MVNYAPANMRYRPYFILTRLPRVRAGNGFCQNPFSRGDRKSGIDPLARTGVPVWIDRGARIAHAKAMVIDDAVTLMGSMNWTANAGRNSKDLNLVASQAAAAAY